MPGRQLSDIDLTGCNAVYRIATLISPGRRSARKPLFSGRIERRGEGFWAVTTWSDVRRVLADYAMFTSERGFRQSSMLDSPDPAAGEMMQAY